MIFRKMFLGILLVAFSVSAMAYDNLVENEAYFKQAIEKAKATNFGDGRVIAVLDTGINDDNSELRGKVIDEYDFLIFLKIKLLINKGISYEI